MKENWKIDDESYKLIKKWLEEHKPKRILELGSGKTSALFSNYARKNGAMFMSLEHIPYWFRHTKKFYKVRSGVYLVPLKKTKHGTFYAFALPRDIDFVLIDGLPESIGRNAALYNIWKYLSKDFTAYLDDANRDGEVKALENWKRDFKVKVTPTTARGVWITRG